MLRTDNVEILGQLYTFRAISRKEYRTLLEDSKGDSISFEDSLAELATITLPETFPGWDECLAGIPNTLAKSILYLSGLGGEESIKALQDEVHVWASTQEARIDALICFCFPTIKPDDLEDLDPLAWYRYAAMAQMILIGLHGMDPTPFITGEPAKQQPAQQPMIPAQGMLEPKAYGVNKQVSQIENLGVMSFTK
jgi:hypothetical protein